MNKPTQKEFPKFWYNIKDSKKIDVSFASILSFLKKVGFGWINISGNKDGQKKLAKVDKDKHMITLFKEDEIISYIFNYAEKYGGKNYSHIINAIGRNQRNLLTEFMMKALPSITYLRAFDSDEVSYFHFKNKIIRALKIKSNEDILSGVIPSELPGIRYFINTEQIDRNVSIDSENIINVNKSEFAAFLTDVSRDDKHNCSAVRYFHLLSIWGYLLCRYKDPSSPPAVLLLDSIASHSAQGGTGKGVFIKSLGHCRNLVNQDGKGFKAYDKFIFDMIDETTDIFCLNDIRKTFNFESLFNLITDDATIERKYEKKHIIPFQATPKIILATNSYISGSGGSYTRRLAEFEFSNYYNQDNTPFNKFGHRLFDDWDDEEWSKFYSLAAIATSYYLSKGIVESEPLNKAKRILYQKVPSEFMDFAKDHLVPSPKANKKDLLNKYNDEFANPEIKQHTFTKLSKIYMDGNDIKYREWQSGGEYLFEIFAKEMPEVSDNSTISMADVTN
jgi:hypothetical protein